METILCWVGIGLWGYGWVLRRWALLDRIAARPRWLAVEHMLFLAGGGVLAGSLLHSLFNAQQSVEFMMVVGGVAGGVFGLWQGWRRGRSAEDRREVLRADLEWIDTSSSAVLLAACIMYFLVQAFQIPSGSMRDTLREGDHLFVNKFIYGVRIPWTYRRVCRFRPVERGQVLVFLCPPAALSSGERARHLKKDFIKRVIGLPGERVEVREKRVWINGQPLTEPYANFRDPRLVPRGTFSDSSEDYQRAWEEGRLVERAGFAVRDTFGPVMVPPGCYFVMGDNRDGSFDSRFWGPLSDRYVKGKAWFLYWPFTRMKIIH